jgi:AbrB family transcriptional regulator (stage V sporulation protein T)
VKSTGVLRRIDELGRIVIPKEIRKNLKIRDGESLEIFVENESIILKKFSMISDMSDIAQFCSDAIQEVIKKDIIITDRDKVIAASGSLKKKYLDKEIGSFIQYAISRRDNYVEKFKKK